MVNNEEEFLQKGFTEDEIARRKLKTICKALHEGWKADMIHGQKKWSPCFIGHPLLLSDFVFTYSSYANVAMGVDNTFHLCFKSKELSDYAGKTFIDLYAKLIK